MVIKSQQSNVSVTGRGGFVPAMGYLSSTGVIGYPVDDLARFFLLSRIGGRMMVESDPFAEKVHDDIYRRPWIIAETAT